MRIIKSFCAVACIAASSVLIACAKQPAPAAAPTTTQAATPVETRDGVPWAGSAKTAAATGASKNRFLNKNLNDEKKVDNVSRTQPTRPAMLAIGPDVVKGCKLAARPVELGLGSNARLDRRKLRKLADCLNLPPFDQAEITLIERGGAESEESAGEDSSSQRAKRIRDILLDNGVAPERIKVSPTDEPEASHAETAKKPVAKADVVLVTETGTPR